MALKLPNSYISQATLLVVQQKVSQRYVESDNTTTSAAAVQAMKLEVLSRNQLLKIIDDLGLYGSEREQTPSELLVEKMLKDIDIEPLETTPGRIDFDAFTIAFTAGSARLAQEVTSRLTSLFIEQDSKTRGEQAENTTRFLTEQLDSAKQRLTQQEQRLQAFKTSNLGELPEQQQANLAALSNAREQLSATAMSLLQAQQQRASIESAIGSLLNDRLTRLRAERAKLLTRYTALYPEVIANDKQIAQLQAVLDRVNRQTPDAGTAADSVSPDDPALAGLIRQVGGRCSAGRDLKSSAKETKRGQRAISGPPQSNAGQGAATRRNPSGLRSFQARLYGTAQQEAAIRADDQPGGKARRPAFSAGGSAHSTDQTLGASTFEDLLGGMAAGILFGFALAFLADVRDSSFHDEKNLAQSFALPLVMGIPLVLSPAECRTLKWKRGFEWIAGSAMTIAMFAAEFYVFRHG